MDKLESGQVMALGILAGYIDQTNKAIGINMQYAYETYDDKQEASRQELEKVLAGLLAAVNTLKKSGLVTEEGIKKFSDQIKDISPKHDGFEMSDHGRVFSQNSINDGQI